MFTVPDPTALNMTAGDEVIIWVNVIVGVIVLCDGIMLMCNGDYRS